MTDLFGPWDALLLLVVVLCVTGLRWKRQQRRACIKPTQRTRFQQMSDLCVNPPKLRARYDKPDARWGCAVTEGEVNGLPATNARRASVRRSLRPAQPTQAGNVG